MRKLTLGAGLLLLILLPFTAAAQTEDAPTLEPGVAVEGSLDATAFAASYIFAGSTGDVISLEATTASEGLILSLLVNAPGGSLVAQDGDATTPGEASINNFTLPVDGTYQVTVVRGNEAGSEVSGDFSLTLTGTLTPPPTPTPAPATSTSAVPTLDGQVVTLENGGLEIGLDWAAAVNLNLEVRDPVGGSVFPGDPGNPETASGGVLEAEANQNCDTATADSPSELIAWPQGDVPAGSYEIIIHYVDGCTVGGPQQFTLTAGINGEEEESLPGILNPGQDYLANVILNTDGTWSLNFGGVNAGLDVGALVDQIAAATPLTGTTASGRINRLQPAIAYTVQGAANSNVTITMDRVSGSLDTYLILLRPDGAELARNDDRDDTTTNSTIVATLPEAGTYTIVASRYGQAIGGTEGDFTLTFAQGAATAAIPTTAPDTTGTDTTAVETPAAPVVTATPEGGLPAGVTLPDGSVEVLLTWATRADVQLLVRDPLGNAIYDDQPTASTTGGILAQGGNARCESSETPVSYIYWPTTRLQRGIYEIEVWYQANCDDINPVIFDLSVTVAGEEIISVQEPLTLDSRYMITFQVNQDDTVDVGEGGQFQMSVVQTLDYFDELGAARPVEYGDVVSDSITLDNKYDIYSFEASTGDTIRLSMERTGGGTLDPALYLLSPDGIQLTFNDDLVTNGERTTNSLIDGYVIDAPGTYYIIATHYGLQFGGTVGTYNLRLLLSE